MAVADYDIRGVGEITPSALLNGTIGEGARAIGVSNYSVHDGVQPAVGMGIMIDGEIMVITAVNMPVLGVSRGCADTIPAAHSFGTKIWFITEATGSDDREYMATEQIGVKVLMKSSSSTMGVANSPPNTLTFNQRFARPYPPGNVMVNNRPFYSSFALNLTQQSLDVSWAHRDRITQGDTLQGHDVGSIGPEVGTTYRLRVFDQADNLVRSIEAIEGTSVSYGIFDAIGDLDIDLGSDEDFRGYMLLDSVREGFTSWQAYRMNFTANAVSLVSGWGKSWGFGWGT